VLKKDGICYYDEFGVAIEKTPTHVDWDVESAKKGNHAHFMIKETARSPTHSGARSSSMFPLRSIRLKATRFPWDAERAKSLDRLTIVSCGTAYHAAMLGKKFIEHLAKLQVDVDIASEFRYGDTLLKKGEPFMVISQSGETADTIAAMRRAKELGCETVAVCNVTGSTISREAGHVLYTYAGPEIAVAAHKNILNANHRNVPARARPCRKARNHDA
jgi:glucosamine--fructose-6-phosphate aminotransferase (isomerizing)